MVEETIRLAVNSVLQRTEDYKNSVEIVIKNYNKQLQETDDQLKEILEQLDLQQNLNKDAARLIAKVNDEMKILEIENIHLEKSLGGLKDELKVTRGKLEEVEQSKNELQQELDEEKISNEKLQEKLREASMQMADIERLMKPPRVTFLEEQNNSYNNCGLYKKKESDLVKEVRDLNEMHRTFSERCEQFEQLFMKCKTLEDRNAELEETVLKTEKLIQPFRPQLEAYSIEKEKIEESSDSEEEVLRVKMRYKDIIKRQTHKQKIKDLIELKERNLDFVKRQLDMDTFSTNSQEDDNKKA